MKKPREAPRTSGSTTMTSIRWAESILNAIVSGSSWLLWDWPGRSGNILLRLRRVHLECNSRLLGAGKRLPSSTREVPENQISGHCRQCKQQHANRPIAKNDLADPEQRCVYQHAAHQPVKGIVGKVANLRDLRRQHCDLLPSVDAWTHPAIKRQQLIVRFGGREEGCDDPCDR